ncbi:MAG: VWA domain-containing protein [Gemmatimonadales bacterium]|nr:VWA domain-containing protein [Gemmatimonadales bacterium]
MRLGNPFALLLLALPLWAAWRQWAARRDAPPGHLALPALPFLGETPAGPRAAWMRLLPVLRVLALTLVVLALARPQTPKDVRDVRVKSRNVILALDISSSMKAGDFQPGNRLFVARRVVGEFVKRRQNDLVGLVIFAGRAFLQAPLTPDLDVLQQTVKRVDIGLLPDGTAIGTALALSLNQLKNLPHAASTIVLITDGANNTGRPTPAQAAEAARALGVRVHTIGVSTADTGSIALNGVWKVGNTAARLTSADEVVLRRVSDRTGGRYFRATDPDALSGVMDQIDKLERTEVKVSETRDYRELFVGFLIPALALLALDIVLGATRLRSLP